MAARNLIISLLSVALLLATALNLGACLICSTDCCDQPACTESSSCHCACALICLGPPETPLDSGLILSEEIVAQRHPDAPSDLAFDLDRPPRTHFI